MQAHAVVATRPRCVEFRPVTVPEPGPEEVVVRVLHSWISNGTEGSFIRGERIAGDTPRGDADPLPFPHVPGYQKVGVVEWVGSSVPALQSGALVFATVSRVEGMFYPAGGHVSPAVTHFEQVWRLPERLEPEAASGLVLTQVGYNVAMRPRVAPGDAVVVIGDGMVGHWAAQTFQVRGARVMLVGRHDDRLARFSAAPGSATTNERRDEVRAAVRNWAPEGVQVVADTVGSIPAVEALLPLMRHDGHISSAGFYGPHGQIDIQWLREREITLHAPSGWSRSRMDATLDMLARGEIRTLPLVTHRFPAASAAEAFDRVLSRREGVLGVLLDWE
ncbi:MAG: zinc-binding dehydrogenase [Chthonomonadales bacterium]|nr:zinc-binding dehydrogenase [Chthonomonadales bacterium]